MDTYNSDFPPRNRIVEQIFTSAQANNGYNNKTDYSYLTEQAKLLNLDDINFESTQFDKINTKIEKQEVYFWIRVFLSEELNEIEQGDIVSIKYVYSGEKLETKFICYAKEGTTGANVTDPQMAHYNGEDNKKVLCLMVNEEKINNDSDDIPFIRRLFRIGRHYEYELLRRSDLVLTIERTNTALNYYDIEF